MTTAAQLVRTTLGSLTFVLLSHCGQTVTAGTSADSTPVATDAPTVALDQFAVDDAAPQRCVEMATAEMIAPSLLFEGQAFGVTLRSNVPGPCGCRAELSVASVGPSRQLTMQRCSCCEDCDCLATGFEASALFGQSAVGQVELDPSRPIGSVQVHTRLNAMGCRPAVVNTIEIIRPTESAQHSALRLYWARLTGTHRNCCMAKVGFVDRRVGDDFELEPKSCDTAGCEECMARVDEPFTSDFLLGSLAPGTYRVAVSNHVSEFTVPR